MLPLTSFVIQHLSFKEGNINECRVRLGSVKNRFAILVLETQRRFPSSSIMPSLGLVLRLEHCVETVIVKFKVASSGQRSEKP